MTENINISRIELQNPRKKTYALYQQDVFLTEITEDTLVHFALSKDSTLSKKQFNRLIQYDKVTLCLRQSYNYLQRRPYLQKELQRKLKLKKFTQDIIDQAVVHLKKNKYINDDEYIRMFIRDAIRQAKSGPMLIKKKLIEKGAALSKIEPHLDELFSFEQQYKIALKLLQLKNQKINENTVLVQKQKLQTYGMGRGFNWGVLESVINQIIKE
jgi:regulatory protein